MAYEVQYRLVDECAQSKLLTKYTETKVALLILNTKYIQSITCTALRLLLDSLRKTPYLETIYQDDANYIFDVQAGSQQTEQSIAQSILQGCIDRDWREIAQQALFNLQEQYADKNVCNFINELRMALSLREEDI